MCKSSGDDEIAIPSLEVLGISVSVRPYMIFRVSRNLEIHFQEKQSPWK